MAVTPGLPDPSWYENLPTQLQWIVAVVFGLLTIFGATRNYSSGKAKAPEPAAQTDIAVSSMTVADMGPVRKMAEHLGTLARLASALQPHAGPAWKVFSDHLKVIEEEARKTRLATEGILEQLTENRRDDEMANQISRQVEARLRELRDRDDRDRR